MIALERPVKEFLHNICGVLLLMLCLSFLACNSAQARPEYARKESKACQYCHVSLSPGLVTSTGLREATTRNNRGVYYETHNHTFEGYVEKQIMGVKSPPVFHFIWKEDLTDNPRRLAVADVTGDGKPRLITLNEKPGQTNAATLTVKKWDGKAFVTQFTADDQAAPDKLAVGKFAGADRPAVILTGDALWTWKGTTFVRKPSTHPLDLFGTTHLRNGQERVLITNSATDIKAYRVQPDASGDWLTDPIDTPKSSEITFGDMHATPAFFQQIIPAELSALTTGGLLGLWDVRNFGTVFLYFVKVDQDFDVKADPKNPTSGTPQFTLKSQASYVIFRNPSDANDAQQLELWSTPRLKGVVYDVALQNPEAGGQSGLLVLTSEAASGTGRSLYFFGLD